MELLSKYNKGIRFLLCAIDIFSKYAWVVPLKDKKGISSVKSFQSILKQSNRKPNKIWVDKGSELYNAYFKKWLRDNDIVMYSTHNEGKSVVAERFIRTLKGKIYKYMTSISKNVYLDKLDDIVDKYNPKCKLIISSFLTLPHLLDCLNFTRNAMSIVLSLQILGGWNRWGVLDFILGCG